MIPASTYHKTMSLIKASFNLSNLSNKKTMETEKEKTISVFWT